MPRICTHHRYREALIPLGIKSLLLCLRLVDALPVEVEDNEGIGLATTVDTVNTVTIDEIDPNQPLVYSSRELWTTDI